MMKLSNCFQSWEVCHVPRIANYGAHGLTKLALALEEDHLWRDDFPICIGATVFAKQEFV